MKSPREIALRVGDDPAFEAFLSDRIYEYNSAATGYHDAELFTAACRSTAGEIEGGISGYTWGGCCFISNLWVAQHMRGQGLGSSLLAAAEAHATGRRCALLLLSSHSFQAPAFYARNGYQPLARIDDYPVGHADIFYSKRLRPR